jgi:uncharacterized protein
VTLAPGRAPSGTIANRRRATEVTDDAPVRTRFHVTGFLTDWFDPVRDGLDRLGDGLFANTLRLGVTGLRRSGKTVFVTSLVNNLLKADRLPFLGPAAEGRLIAARLEPQPDLAVPRFDYETRLAEVVGTPPRWPAPTQAVSRLRLAIRYRPVATLRQWMGAEATLTLDIVDYPGEWLMDLPMLDQSYAAWSAQTLALAERPVRRDLARDWTAHMRTLDPQGPADETVARSAAELYTAYLEACRASDAPLSLLQPGRFLEPGEMRGAPALAFAPLPVAGATTGRGTLARLMEDRYEAYKRAVVRRFFREHFAHLDRQVVLIDLLGALNGGAEGVRDLRGALTAGLEAFRHGRAGRIERLFRSRIDKVLFVATKADHVASSQHGLLRRLLGEAVEDARNAIRFEGAQVETMAAAAVRSTTNVRASVDGTEVDCVQGVRTGADGRTTVLFPGELPERLSDLDRDDGPRHRFLAFDPPAGLGADGRALAHVRMDAALDFLIGDRLS